MIGKPHDMVLLTDMSPLLPGNLKVYIGNDPSGQCPNTKRLFNIQLIFNLAGGVFGGKEMTIDEDEGKVNFFFADDDDVNIEKYFQMTFEMIEKHFEKKKGAALIHCAYGQSRSGTILLHYIMRKNKWGLRKTFERCRERHKRLMPNRGFMKQLIEVEKKYMKEGILHEDTVPYTMEESNRYYNTVFKPGKFQSKYSFGITTD